MESFVLLFSNLAYIISSLMFVLIHTLFLGYGFLILFLMFCYGFFGNFLTQRAGNLIKFSGFVVCFFIGVLYGFYSATVWPAAAENCQYMCNIFDGSSMSILQPLTGFAAYLLAIGGLQLGRYFYRHIGPKSEVRTHLA